MSLVSEFKEFVLRGNVVDLAVGVAIGGAFTAVVGAFSKDIINPLIGAVLHVDFDSVKPMFLGVTWDVGDLLSKLFTFLITALVVFLAVVKPVNYLMAHYSKPADPTTKECPECLTQIPLAAKKCSACTSDQPA